MYYHPTPAVFRLIRTLGSLGLCAGALALAQQTTPAQPVAPSEEALVLSPFSVTAEKDIGYAATSSLMGGRLNTSLADTAASVSVLNEQFLQDLGLTTLTEAAEWAPGAVNVYRDEPNPFNDYQVQIRNLGASYQTSKNFFRYYMNPDAFFTERIDFGRGPNSLVFGDTGVAGAFNTSSKRARNRNFRKVEAQYYSTGGYRAGFDVNQRLNDDFQARVVYMNQDSDGWQDRERTQFEGAAGTFTWRPFKKTTVWGEFEYGFRKSVMASGVFDRMSSWDGTTTVSAPLAANPATATGLSRLGTRYVFNTAAPQLGVVNWQNFGETNGTNIRLAPAGFDAPAGWGLPADARRPLPTISHFGYSANFPDSNFSNRLRGVTFVVEQQLSDKFFAEAGINKVWSETSNSRLVYRTREMRVDVNQTLPDGRPNPYFRQTYFEGFDEPEAQYREPTEGRVSLAYVDNFKLAEVRALAGWSFRDDLFDVVRLTRAYTAGTNPDLSNTANRIYFRRYINELDAPFFMPEHSIVFRNSNTVRRDKYHRSWQGFVSAKWFENRRLLTSVGYRLEWVREKGRNATVDATTKMMNGWTDETLRLDKKTPNWNYNAIYRLTDWVSVYGAYAESFEFTGGSTALDNSALPMITAEGIEGGLRFNLFDNRVNATLMYYNNKRLNQRLSGSGGDINDIWTDLGPAFSNRLVASGYNDTQSWKGTGYELEVVANPTRNWRVSFNYSIPEATQIEGYEATKAYYAANLPLWQAEVAKLNPATDGALIGRINQNITDIKNRNDSFAEGRELNNSYKFTANAFANYTFSEGRLRGLSAGAGVNVRGERLVANRPNAPFDYIWGDGYYTVTARLGYTFKVYGRNLRLAVNIRNLFDQQDPALAANFHSNITYMRSDGTNGSVFLPRMYTVEAPRSATFTASYEF